MKLNRKNKLLVLGVIVMSLLGYFLAVKKSLLLKEEYQALSQRDELAQNVGVRLSILSEKEKNLDSEFNQLNLGATSLQNNLLRVLNEHGMEHGVKMIEFNAPHIVQINETESKTHIFTLDGSYNAILKAIHSLEMQGSFGRITHVDLKKKKDYRNGRSNLQAKVFLEQVN